MANPDVMAFSTSVAVPPTSYPLAPEILLKQSFVGRDVRDIDGPAAIVDVAVVRKNCSDMLEAVAKLDLGFRAHVKTHKTSQMARLQVGDDAPTPAKFVVSTIQEAEKLTSLLDEYKKRGREISVLYGIPPSSTAFARMKKMREMLGNESFAFLVDHPAQLRHFVDPSQKTAEAVPVFVKIDVGMHRAGVAGDSNTLDSLLEAIAQSQQNTTSAPVKLMGFYSHNSHSYGANSFEECAQYLLSELEQIRQAADRARAKGLVHGRIALSVGSSPSVLSVQNLGLPSTLSEKTLAMFASMKELYDVELHAGVFPLLDRQQISSRSRPASSQMGPTMTEADIGLTIMAEVLSVYTERSRPEVLIGSGTLALGREPCKAYHGWGVLAPRPWLDRSSQRVWSEDDKTGWIVGRISQEHGILEWQGALDALQPLNVGDKVFVWPNHACIASAGFDWYMVVDSQESRTQIVDVWTRCRGW